MLKRKSIRTYNKESISQELKQKIADYISTIKVPFNAKIRFKILDLNTLEPNIKLGTYGCSKEQQPSYVQWQKRKIGWKRVWDMFLRK